jgi:hypothetical protein
MCKNLLQCVEYIVYTFKSIEIRIIFTLKY